MTDKAIFLALAKLDGWEYHKCLWSKESGDPYSAKFGYTGWLHKSVKWESLDWQNQKDITSAEPEPPDYLADYNAIIALIQKQPIEIKRAIAQHLLMTQESFYMLDATPRQLCIATLKATGKWEK